jgi:hypothetical protein
MPTNGAWTSTGLAFLNSKQNGAVLEKPPARLVHCEHDQRTASQDQLAEPWREPSARLFHYYLGFSVWCLGTNERTVASYPQP